MLSLALPVIGTYLGFMLMGVVDLVCVGRVSAQAIGAVGVGTSLFSWVMVFGIGLLAGLDYLVAYAQGASKPEDGYRALAQSLLATSALSVPMTLGLILLACRLGWLGINPDVLPHARGYLIILAWSLWPALVFNACRQYLTAKNVALPAMIILMAANLLNAAVNWVLVFGHWGAPALAERGSAYATLISRLLMMVAMAAYLVAWDRKHEGLIGRVPFGIDVAEMKRFLRLGLPSALQMVFEVGVFALSTTLAAHLAAESLAAHQIVLNIASLTFMVPLGISSATAVLVGQELGRGSRPDASRIGWRGISYGVSFMACSGLTLFFARSPILALFTSDVAVREIGARILLIAALFQLSDGTQIVTAGALRGLGDTRSPMLANLGGHWLIGLPAGLLLCFKAGYGLLGLWIGLSLGLTSVAAALIFRWKTSASLD
jgi:MATE family multidrug resistance protein